MESSSSSQNGPDAGRFHSPATGGVTGGRAAVAAWRAAHLVRQAEERRAHSRASDRARFWFAIRVASTCWMGTLGGLLCMGWGLHTTNLAAGKVAWAVGQFGGSLVVVVTLVVGWMRWERDDW